MFHFSYFRCIIFVGGLQIIYTMEGTRRAEKFGKRCCRRMIRATLAVPEGCCKRILPLGLDGSKRGDSGRTQVPLVGGGAEAARDLWSDTHSSVDAMCIPQRYMACARPAELTHQRHCLSATESMWLLSSTSVVEFLT
jgi:hypothetical protein